jgi:hypothetical protein
VFIIAHVPVGYLPFTRDVTAIRKRHNERLVYIFRKYSHVITGHFYGHTHRDSVMVLLDEEGRYMEGGLSPHEGWGDGVRNQHSKPIQTFPFPWKYIKHLAKYPENNHSPSISLLV